MNLFAIFCYITVTCDNQPKSAVGTRSLRQSNVTGQSLATSPPPPPADGRKTVREAASYPTRYDYIDVEAVMSNERIIKILINCVLNRGPCTREGLELKRIVPDAIQTECSKCSERQRVQAGKVLAHLLQHKPEYWKMLVQKFDPNNVYLRRYMADDDDDDNEKLSLQKISNDSNASKN